MTQPMTPFDYWLSAFRAPLSGDVTQTIDPRFFSPNVTVEFQGDAEVEGRIVSRVASYGSQLDTLIEAVQVLAAAQGVEVPELAKLAEDIAAEKAAHKDGLKDRAEAALEALREGDPEGYGEVLKGL